MWWSVLRLNVRSVWAGVLNGKSYCNLSSVVILHQCQTKQPGRKTSIQLQIHDNTARQEIIQWKMNHILPNIYIIVAHWFESNQLQRGHCATWTCTDLAHAGHGQDLVYCWSLCEVWLQHLCYDTPECGRPRCNSVHGWRLDSPLTQISHSKGHIPPPKKKNKLLSNLTTFNYLLFWNRMQTLPYEKRHFGMQWPTAVNVLIMYSMDVFFPDNSISSL